MASSRMRAQRKQLRGSRSMCPGCVEALVPAFVCSPEIFLGSHGTGSALYCIGSLKYMLFKVIINVHLKFGWKRNTRNKISLT